MGFLDPLNPLCTIEPIWHAPPPAPPSEAQQIKILEQLVRDAHTEICRLRAQLLDAEKALAIERETRIDTIPPGA